MEDVGSVGMKVVEMEDMRAIEEMTGMEGMEIPGVDIRKDGSEAA